MASGSTKPRLLIVLPSHVVGGAETKFLGLLKSQSSFERIILTHNELKDYFSSTGTEVATFGEDVVGRLDAYTPKDFLGYARSIKRAVDQFTPDITLGVMHTGSLFVSAARDIYRARTTPVLTFEGNVSAYFQSVGRTPSWWERLLMRWCLHRAAAVITPSEGVRSDLTENFGADPEKVKTVYNGIDLQNVRRRGEEQIDIVKDRTWIVTASRLTEQKDFRTLLAAFAKIRGLSKSRLVIVGDGELRADIEGMINEMSLSDDVTITGFKDNPYAYIKRSDVFVLSSFYEGFANVIVEAMALGVPVVATDCPSGPAEIISDAQNGYLVPMKDAVSMAKACLSLLTDDDTRKRISGNGMRRSEDFSMDAMASGFDNVLLDVLEGNRRG